MQKERYAVSLEKVNTSAYLAKLTAPVFVELLLQLLVGNMDQLMISQYSQVSVAAIGNANQILNIFILTFSVISLAVTILTAQYIGAQNREMIARIYSLALFLNGAVGLLISAVLLLFSRPIFTMMQVPPEIMEESCLYISIVGGFLFLQAIALTFSAIFRSNSLPRITMYISIIVNVVNIVGNLILIYGVGPIPAFGIAGGAISSVVSRFLGVILLVVFFAKMIRVRISIKNIVPFPKALFQKMMMIGLPSGGESLSYNFTQIVIFSMINLFGTSVITAKVYCSMLAMCAYLFGSALSQATQVVVGYLMGAKKIPETHKRVMSTLRITILASGSFSVILYLLSDFIFQFLTQDPTVIALCKTVMLIEIPLEISRAVNMVLVRSLQAAGDVKFPVILGIGSEWAVAVGLSFLFGVVLGWGLIGVWIAMTLDETFRAVLFLIRWFQGRWKQKSLVAG